MGEDEKKAIEDLNSFKSISILYGNTFTMFLDQLKKYQQATDIVLNLVQNLQRENDLLNNYVKENETYKKNLFNYAEKKDKQIDLIKEYVHQEIAHCTETIKDYIDDDKEGNKHYIEELKEDREHWKDIEKILQNKPKEELYMNWWRYGLYE